MGFWDRARAEVKRQNTTQDWVAVKTDISLRTIQGWISKGRLPDAAEASRIASVLGVTVEYLVTGTDASDPWLREHRQLVEDLKALTIDDLRKVGIQVHALAEDERSKRGKDSASG